MASDIMTLYPYMNGRNVPITDANVLLVPFNGTITFKWGVEQAGTNIPTWYIITANGRWGGQTADHYPIIGIVDSLASLSIAKAFKGKLFNRTGGLGCYSDCLYSLLLCDEAWG